tara:strand:+ start:3303 stop:3686 length:384 start_codon:yes stop_codon:yes gene_type:complete
MEKVFSVSNKKVERTICPADVDTYYLHSWYQDDATRAFVSKKKPMHYSASHLHKKTIGLKAKYVGENGKVYYVFHDKYPYDVAMYIVSRDEKCSVGRRFSLITAYEGYLSEALDGVEYYILQEGGIS